MIVGLGATTTSGSAYPNCSVWQSLANDGHGGPVTCQPNIVFLLGAALGVYGFVSNKPMLSVLGVGAVAASKVIISL